MLHTLLFNEIQWGVWYMYPWYVFIKKQLPHNNFFSHTMLIYRFTRILVVFSQLRDQFLTDASMNWLIIGLTHWPLGNLNESMYLILQIIAVIDGWGISWELALRCMSLDLTDDKSTLVQVMVWCHQATSHYLSQCWPRSLSPYGITRPQWVNSLATERSDWNLGKQFSY